MQIVKTMKRAPIAALALFAGALAFASAGSVHAQQKQNETYTLAGLKWGMKLADARTALSRNGFRVTTTTAGKQREFAIDRLHAVYATLDRGRRLSAVGSISGYQFTADLSFGKNDSLHHVVLVSRFWDGSVKGARAMITQAEKIVGDLEKQYGVAKKRRDDGWADTAVWSDARDGSTLAFNVRGLSGFMFSPSYKTAMRIDYALPKLNNGNVAGLKMDLNSTGWSDGPGHMAPRATAPARATATTGTGLVDSVR